MTKPTDEILARVASRDFSLTDPCVICGVAFSSCPHSSDDTEKVIKKGKLTLAERRRRERGK